MQKYTKLNLVKLHQYYKWPFEQIKTIIGYAMYNFRVLKNIQYL